MQERGKLIIFSAPSGSGKSTLINYLMQQGLPLSFSVSATSREPRGSEVHGKEYYFLTADEFRQRIDAEEFLEYEEVYPGKFYGTLKCEVERLRNAGRHVMFDVDVVGGVNIKKFCLGTEDGVFDGYIDLYVHDMGDLEKLTKKLEKIEGIQSVIRTDL